MSLQDNSEQREQWNGTTGDTWTMFQDSLDKMMTPVTDALFAAIAPQPGERILDVGCGCGPTTIRLARAVAPGGEITGLDISGVLLKSARERAAAQGANATFIEADASTYDFGAKKGSYDKIVSRFGVMFFADPVAAFQNLRTALKPGGKLIFACWRAMGENRWMNEMVEEAAKLLPMPAMPRPTGYVPGPFAFEDEAFLRGMLKDAGFTTEEITPLSPKLKMPGDTVDEAIAFTSRVGPMAGLMREADDETKAKVEALIKSSIEARFAKGNPPQDAACWLVRANG
jgi:ubiquinone/menaquinone biosynthesis C-methylase UbiE